MNWGKCSVFVSLLLIGAASVSLADIVVIDGHAIGGTLLVDRNYTCRQFKFEQISSPKAAWDWRNVGGENYLTAVKDQANCGACWAFGTVGAFESQVKIDNNDTSIDWDLSERFADACYDSVLGTPSCATGWYSEYALEHMANAMSGVSTGTPGICTETCYPYGDMVNGTDPTGCGTSDSPPACANYLSERVYLDGFSELWGVGGAPANADELIKNAITTHGPVIVTMVLEDYSSTNPDWVDFVTFWNTTSTTSVWSGPDGACTEPDCGGHCVLIVGYNDSATTPYWIVRNSWGVAGPDNDGYFRMEMGYDNSNIYYHPMVVDAPAVSATDVPTTSPFGVLAMFAVFSAIFGTGFWFRRG